MFDDIVAISSGGKINQPIGIVRLSGPTVLEVVKKVFSNPKIEHSTASYGYIRNGNQTIDEVLVIYFKGPNSFTGEDIIEINAHGGMVVLQNILELFFSLGLRQAEKGEFTRRAFLNGKIDLIKAEAIHDLIFSKTQKQAQLSVKQFGGKTSKFISEIKNKILLIIGQLEVNIDYPEYDDVELKDDFELANDLELINAELEKSLIESKISEAVFNGINVTIVGAPNAGKSSLLNKIVGDDKAIVTDIAGTTTDVIESSFQYQGILFNLKDTAGIRNNASTKIEEIGIQRTKKAISESEIIIHLIASDQSETLIDKEIKELSKNKKYIQVISKSDIAKKEGFINVSVKNGDIDNLLNRLVDDYKDVDWNSSRIVNNARQLSLIKMAEENIKSALDALKQGMTADVVIVDLHEAWNNLENITGKADNEKLLDSMFSNFCLGK
ncbi:tRNA modification GTPase [Mycoplasma testudineum]|uniref:tRNA modification GTPase MnmE n=1 Tax=Mycoplasma testudineum TaxID=244584 RepID=A0A4R6ID04_9MOLU|nr:tRNA uridine-5-carboxymethylaminomethyl(34) synthesis GTPase MnmE [Mycoplasma testudineum]OYD26736.1 tRNA uridine-5-carboxymethylaminomethyl(34) synthesis GTPase MnmE [Mycoplasma testudineum]TDO19872.1 tRNA modification GTPase [Mycoplasma testudineum]